MEKPLGRRGTASGHWDMALEMVAGRSGLSSGFYVLLVKVGGALFKEPDLVCCDT